MAPQAQLRIAARIHYALKHLLGEGIDVAGMLNSPDQAREVLFVCQASGNTELMALARQYVVAGQLAEIGKSPGPGSDSPQDASWASNTSGFGVSQTAELAHDAPRELPQPGPVPRKNWLPKPSWLRRGEGK
jgi:hypothetical protein